MSYEPWSGRPHATVPTEITVEIDRPYRLLEGGPALINHGLWLWCSAVALARVLAKRDLSGKRVIEFGAGLGLPGMVAAANGASVTFCDHLSATRIKENLALNGLTGTVLDSPWSNVEGSWDLGIAADALTYQRDLLMIVERTCDNFILVDGIQFDVKHPRGSLTVPEKKYTCHVWAMNVLDLPPAEG